jgi:hypothetical protein
MPLAIFALLFLVPKVAPNAVDHLKAVIDAARAREERLRTVTIAWKVTTHVPKGAILAADSAGRPFPRADQTSTSTYTLVVDSDRHREEHNGPDQFTAVFDGTRLTTRTVRPHLSPHAEFDRHAPGEAAQHDDIIFGPVNNWCRGRRRWEADSQQGLVKVQGSEEVIDSVRCLEFRVARTSGNFDSYWLEAGRGYLTRRMRLARTLGNDEVEITYQDHPVVGQVPRGWTGRQAAINGLAMRIRAEVTDVRVGEPVPPETFRLEPSPGDTVIDDETRQRFRVRDDGSLAEVKALDVSELPPEDGPPLTAWPARKLMMVALVAGFAVVLLLVMLLRRPAREPHKPTP